MNKDTFTKCTRIKSYVDPGIDRRHYVQHNHGSVRDIYRPIGRQRGCTFEFGTRCTYILVYNLVPASLSGYVRMSMCLCVCIYVYTCVHHIVIRSSLNALACFSRTRHRNAPWLISAFACQEWK